MGHKMEERSWVYIQTMIKRIFTIFRPKISKKYWIPVVTIVLSYWEEKYLNTIEYKTYDLWGNKSEQIQKYNRRNIEYKHSMFES